MSSKALPMAEEPIPIPDQVPDHNAMLSDEGLMAVLQNFAYAHRSRRADPMEYLQSVIKFVALNTSVFCKVDEYLEHFRLILCETLLALDPLQVAATDTSPVNFARHTIQALSFFEMEQNDFSKEHGTRPDLPSQQLRTGTQALMESNDLRRFMHPYQPSQELLDCIESMRSAWYERKGAQRTPSIKRLSYSGLDLPRLRHPCDVVIPGDCILNRGSPGVAISDASRERIIECLLFKKHNPSRCRYDEIVIVPDDQLDVNNVTERHKKHINAVRHRITEGSATSAELMEIIRHAKRK